MSAAQVAENAVAAVARKHPSLGLAVGVIGRDGTAVRVSDDRFGASASFSIGSVTKTFTGLALAVAAGRGEVWLDEPLADLVPPGVRVRAPITLEQLARHTSGLPRLPRGIWPLSHDPYAKVTDAKLWSALSFATPQAQGHFKYSNFGAAVLGAVLARRGGTDYGSLITERVTEPLGLAGTGLQPGTFRATGHRRNGKPVPDWHFSAMAGCGGLWSNVSDLLRFVQAHLAAEGPLYGALAATRQLKVVPGESRGTGLGWFGLSVPKAADVRWHNGMTSGFASFLGFSRSAGIGVVLLADQPKSVDALGVDMLKALAR